MDFQELTRTIEWDVVLEFAKEWNVDGLVDWVTFNYEYEIPKHDAEELLEIAHTN